MRSHDLESGPGASKENASCQSEDESSGEFSRMLSSSRDFYPMTDTDLHKNTHTQITKKINQ